MRYLWVDSGTAPDYAKAGKHGIDGFYFDMLNVSKAELQTVSAKGYQVGVYMASNWAPFVGKSGREIAELVNQLVKGLSWSQVNKPKVQVDIEEHDPGKVIACLERLRELQPKRDLSWTLEPWQGGWMSSEFVARVLKCRVRVVPQFYMGPSPAEPWDMRPAAGDMVLRDLLKRGFPEQAVSGFYDALDVTSSSRWRGFAFTQQRLSAL